MNDLSAHVRHFRAVLTRRLGLEFDDGKTAALADLLHARSDTRAIDAYLARLEGPLGQAEVRELARELTVGETYFFRHSDQFRAFEEVALPARIRARSSVRALRILSAGCASGEEAYSLAVAVRNGVPDLGSWEARLHGIDVNASMIAKALVGRYSAWSLRETSAERRERHFQPDGRDFRLEEAVRKMVSFEERNLIDDDALFWQERVFDVVFCRNVLMYFTAEAARAVVAKFARSLAPGGFLFLGHAETLRGISQDFHLRHSHDAFYYQRRDEGDAPGFAPSGATPQSPALDLDAPSWAEVIQRSSDRIAQLERGSTPPRPAAKAQAMAGVVDRAAWDLRPAVEMLRQERFVDAMDLLQALPADSSTDADAQILRAVLFTNSGKLTDAEGVCRQILVADELNAGAHYLLALCREHAGDRTAALEHDQAAIHLDAGFVMPHLHLGLLARRAGEEEQARTELSRALSLLPREDASRILLFGGGFARDALIELCRSELQACGGRP
ncbi:MAG: CheR family methyltransferase [Polyangiaceae bacterium]